MVNLDLESFIAVKLDANPGLDSRHCNIHLLVKCIQIEVVWEEKDRRNDQAAAKN